MSTTALDGLVGELTRELGGPARGQRVAKLLGDYARNHEDWREFALFSQESYTRNLVSRDGRFELLILCWGAGQVSPIHNHEGQNCWMAVLDGNVEEVQYCKPEEVRPGPLDPRCARSFARGEVAFIRDDIALHVVRSAHPDRPAVSLHLYAAPYDECSCYCPETGTVTRTPLTNHSVRGELVTQSVR